MVIAVSCNIKKAFQAEPGFGIAHTCVVASGPEIAVNLQVNSQNEGISESVYPRSRIAGRNIARIICDNYRIVNRFTTLGALRRPFVKVRISIKTYRKDIYLQCFRQKKEASADSGGTVIIALAGGGNQSFLTDGVLQARGNGFHRTLLKKTQRIRLFIPRIQKKSKFSLFAGYPLEWQVFTGHPHRFFPLGRRQIHTKASDSMDYLPEKPALQSDFLIFEKIFCSPNPCSRQENRLKITGQPSENCAGQVVQGTCTRTVELHARVWA